ncbi:MAG: rane protein [Fibrobacteres bacterium]|nr:rane protein [Fibrobacterota bacterium]
MGKTMHISKSLLLGTAAVAAGISLSNAQTGTILVHSDLVLNPAYTLTEAHPAGWIPQVGDMTLMPDGKVALLTHELALSSSENTTNVPRLNGKVYLIGNIKSADPEKIDTVLVAKDLREPTGICVVDGKIYVAEKVALTELTLGAPGTLATSRKVADIAVDPLGIANFQEYAFGLLYKDGYFYTATGGGVKIGGLSYADDLSKITEPNRDGILKIKASDGTTELLNGGLRAPNGLAFGPNGTMWVTDNQGAFLPACKLINVVPGRNYGYPNGPSKFRGMAETPPTVWFPYAEIGKSLSHPVYVKTGPFAGQFLMGDICFGGTMRAAVEMVNGEYQGSAHSHSGGFAAGIEATLELDDGSFLLGGLGKGDVANWGWRAKVRSLQRITPKPGVANFEMLALHSKSDGIEIEFTKPVGAGAELASSYTMFHGTMAPGPKYGEGNMQTKTLMAIKSVKVSLDKKRVLLETDAMVPKTVVAVKVAGVKSDAGDSLYRPAAWYTLNSVSTVKWSEATGLKERTRIQGLSSESILAERAGRSLAVTVPFTGNHQLTLRTLRGQALESHSGNGAGKYLLGRAGLAQGVYLIDVKVGDQVMRKSVVF